jgi:uncharacterized protein
MGRLLILAIIVLAGIWLVKRALARADADPPASGAPQDLVGCAQCGVLIPRSEARRVSGAAYCSEEHARLGPRGR